jgi:hypothetical protein
MRKTFACPDALLSGSCRNNFSTKHHRKSSSFPEGTTSGLKSSNFTLNGKSLESDTPLTKDSSTTERRKLSLLFASLFFLSLRQWWNVYARLIKKIAQQKCWTQSGTDAKLLFGIIAGLETFNEYSL